MPFIITPNNIINYQQCSEDNNQLKLQEYLKISSPI